MHTIAIVDDHQIVREGLKGFLDKRPDYRVIATASSINELFVMLEHSRPDLLILDLKLQDGDGVSAALKVKRLYPALKIVLLSGFIEPDMATEAKCIGVEGYLLKTVNLNKLTTAIERIIKGDTVYDPAVDAQASQTIPLALQSLSSQERELIRLMALGMTNKEIAATMNIAEKTARNYTSRLFKKINVENRSEAVGYYMRHCKLPSDRVE